MEKRKIIIIIFFLLLIPFISLTSADETNCTPKWDCGNWTNCIDNIKTKSCTDLNSCKGLKIERINCSCSTEWNCTPWSKCINNVEVRSCVDINLCGNESSKPQIRQDCGTICTPEWDCTSWDPKRCPKDTKIQTRTCTDSNNCETFQQKPEEAKTCSNDFGWLLIFIILIIIILIGGTLLLLKEKRKGKHNSNPFILPPTKPNTQKTLIQKKQFPKTKAIMPKLKK